MVNASAARERFTPLCTRSPAPARRVLDSSVSTRCHAVAEVAAYGQLWSALEKDQDIEPCTRFSVALKTGTYAAL
jgi:hypothetical protein